MSITAPAGWTLSQPNALTFSANDPTLGHGQGQLVIHDAAALSTDTVDSQARGALRELPQFVRVKPVRRADRTVSGVVGYVLTSRSTRSGDVASFYEFGTVTGGRTVSIDVQFQMAVSAADARAVVDSVLSTVQWK